MNDARTISVFGSGEFQPWSIDVDKEALSRSQSGDGSVVILPAASAPEGDDVFMSWAQMGLDHYEQMGVTSRVSALKTRADAHNDDFIAQLDDASMYYFSGGNPAYLSDILRDTPFWAAIVAGVDRGVALAGCSAGACFLGETAPDSNRNGNFEDGDWFVPGLKLLPGLVFGPHWDMLNTWMPGLQQVIYDTTPEDCTLVTLDENTAMLGDGSEWKVFGQGAVGIAPQGTPATSHRSGDTFQL